MTWQDKHSEKISPIQSLRKMANKKFSVDSELTKLPSLSQETSSKPLDRRKGTEENKSSSSQESGLSFPPLTNR